MRVSLENEGVQKWDVSMHLFTFSVLYWDCIGCHSIWKKRFVQQSRKKPIIKCWHTWTNGGTFSPLNVRSLAHGTSPSWSGIVASSIPSLVSLAALWTTLTPLRPTWPATTHWKIRFVQFNWGTLLYAQKWIGTPFFGRNAKSSCKQLSSRDLITCP